MIFTSSRLPHSRQMIFSARKNFSFIVQQTGPARVLVLFESIAFSRQRALAAVAFQFSLGGDFGPADVHANAVSAHLLFFFFFCQMSHTLALSMRFSAPMMFREAM